jgi:hypothetical protein
MTYSKEYMDWTGNVIEPSFEIRLVSAGMSDGTYSDVKCDGLGFIGMYKRKSDHMLLLKMKSSNEQGYQYQTFLDVKRIYVPNFETPFD